MSETSEISESNKSDKSQKNEKVKIEYTFVSSKFLHYKLLYSTKGKYLYSQNKKTENAIYFKCIERYCNERVIFNVKSEECFGKTNEMHDHANHEEKYNANLLESKIKQECLANRKSTKYVKDIFDENLLE